MKRKSLRKFDKINCKASQADLQENGSSWQTKVDKIWISFEFARSFILFRCDSISSVYPGMSVHPSRLLKNGMMKWWNEGIASIDHFWSCYPCLELFFPSSEYLLVIIFLHVYAIHLIPFLLDVMLWWMGNLASFSLGNHSFSWSHTSPCGFSSRSRQESKTSTALKK